MIEGPWLLVVLLLSVAVVIVATARFRVHPFAALLMAAFLVGILARMPLGDLVKAINGGFGGIMGHIGLVIILGTIIGTILEKSGGALKMAEVILRRVGEKRPQLAMSLIGSMVSIPVFCDSGYVILASLKKAIARRSKVSLASMSVALATGLYATHTLVPPTPGPVAAAGNLGAGDHLGTVILIGLIISIPTIAVGYLWATRFAVRIRIEGEDDIPSVGDFMPALGTLPPAWKAFAPILTPIFLIAFGSLVSIFQYTGPGSETLLFLGSPTVALSSGLLVSLSLLPAFKEETLNGWLGEGIRHAAPILLITGAGGALGRVLSETPIADLIKGLAESGKPEGGLILLMSFLIAAGLKTAQGSSTTALVVTSALIAPLLSGTGLESPIDLALIVMAIGAGSMTVSHANDSYFWVVTQFSGLEVKDAYKAQTLATLLQGITAFTVTLALHFVLP